jgi:hypothetical protein
MAEKGQKENQGSPTRYPYEMVPVAFDIITTIIVETLSGALGEQSLFVKWRGWKILGGQFFLYWYCGGQFLKAPSLGAVNLAVKHLVVKKK